jgi:hypothetical protein
MPDRSKRLEQAGEQEFQDWYSGHAKRLGLDPNPDDPRHQYDYRAAHKAGVDPGPDNHWDSRFKSDDHPNRFIDGVDTKTGKRR